MPDFTTFSLFISAAIALAITPGPGILYVMTRSLKGGWLEGIASALGTSVGGMFHVVGAALGLSLVLTTSAIAFSMVKYLGAGYLIYLGIKTILGSDSLGESAVGVGVGYKRAFLQGITVEVLNPKTALFFLAFIPQFINLNGVIFAQFLLLGTISVVLNTSADFMVASFAGPIGQYLKARPRWQKGQRYATGSGLIVLGSYIALAGDNR